MNSGRALAVAGLLLALGVPAGALGVHALQGQLPPERYLIYQTGLQFHFFQALGLLGVGAVLRSLDTRLLRIAAALIAAGVMLFSGSLYALALNPTAAVSFLPPLGAYALIAGWLLFAWGAWRHEARITT